MKGNYLHIAIDGPAASGKGTIAEKLAKELGIIYVYTGAMYRALTLVCLEEGINIDDEQQVLEVLSKHSISIALPTSLSENPFAVFIDDRDVSNLISSKEVSQAVPKVAKIAQVRSYMVKKQQDFISPQSAVAEGRDIGLRVMPDAQLKVYLTASLEERAKRRFKQLQAQDPQVSYEEVYKDTKMRDEIDSQRNVDPLQRLPDAWELDTTNMSQNEVVMAIKEELKRRNLI